MTNEQADVLLDDISAGIVLVITTEALASLPWAEMNRDQKRGAILALDQILGRIKNYLPKHDARLDHVHKLIASTSAAASFVREATGLPPVIG